MANHSHGRDPEGYASASPGDCASDVRRDQPHRRPGPTATDTAKAPRKRGRESPASAAAGTKERRVCLAKPRSAIARSPAFLTSPLLTYAGMCGYDSLLDGLRGGEAHFHRGAEDVLVVACVYFGACPIFRERFEDNLSVAGVSCPLVVEEAFNRSVRHLCQCRCFLRAYRPIREFAFLWRDVAVEDGLSGCGVRRVTKQDVLSGWSCKLSAPPSECKTAESNPSPADVIFVSPDDKEFDTRAKAVNRMNKSLASLQLSLESFRQTTPTTTTDLVRITSKIHPLHSPLGLLEELFLDDPWRLLVSTICLNVTTRTQVDGVLHEFLRRWPSAEATARARWEEVSGVISVLGLGEKRAKALVRFSREYIALTEGCDAFSLDEDQVKGLYFVGEYGWTAYEVFILKRLPSGSVKVCDHALQLYVEYQLGRRAVENQSGIF